MVHPCPAHDYEAGGRYRSGFIRSIVEEVLFRKPSSTNNFMQASSGLHGNQEPRTPSRSMAFDLVPLVPGAALFFLCCAFATFLAILWIPSFYPKHSSWILEKWSWQN